MWQSRVHKVREFESSRPVLNESQLKIISLKNNNKDIKTNNKLFIKMSYARYLPLDYGQNQDKERIHKYSKKILHLALMTPIYLSTGLLLIARASMNVIGWLFLAIFTITVTFGGGARKTRKDKMGPGNRKWDHTFP